MVTATARLPTAPAAGPARIPGLDGLRGVAILLVLLEHGAYSFSPTAARVLGFAGVGALGVNVFFVLSGFLIYTLSVREIRLTGAFAWKQFYLRRILRIFPCFYLFLAVILLLKSCGIITLTRPMVISAATFTLNYRHLWEPSPGPSDYHVIGHYWTLALEEQFYLVWPLLMLLLTRRKLLPVLVGVMVLAPILRVTCHYLTPGSMHQVTIMFHTSCDGIAAGVLLGELWGRPRPRAFLEKCAARGWTVALALGFLFVLSPALTAHWRGAYSMTIGKFLELAGIGLVVVAAVAFPRGLLFRGLNWPPLVFVGTLSYSLYVWNNLFLYPEGGWLVNHFPFNILCIFGAALGSHYLVERPFLRLKNRFEKPMTPPIVGPLTPAPL